MQNLHRRMDIFAILRPGNINQNSLISYLWVASSINLLEEVVEGLLSLQLVVLYLVGDLIPILCLSTLSFAGGVVVSFLLDFLRGVV